MKMMTTILGTIALVAAGTAGAVGATDQELLSAFTSDGAAVASSMTTAELDSIRGEGTFTKTFGVPGLHRDFSNTFTSANGLTSITITGVAGSGITIDITTPGP